MRMFLTLAAFAAAIAGSSAASAHENERGHWEWRSQPSSGPRSFVPVRTRVWVKDGTISVASCDCAMMKADGSGCMMDMRATGVASSTG